MWSKLRRFRWVVSSAETASLSRTRTVGSSRRVLTQIFVTQWCCITNFCQFSFVATKKKIKKTSLHFLNFDSKQKPVANTAIQPAVYASWNVVAKRGAPIVEGKSWVVSGNLRNPFKTAVTVICVSPWIAFPRTHITRDACFPAHISLNTRKSQVTVIYVSQGKVFPQILFSYTNS